MVFQASFNRPQPNKGKTNPSGLAFFVYYRVFARVPAGSCGLRRTISVSNRHVLLSVCTFSLRPYQL